MPSSLFVNVPDEINKEIDEKDDKNVELSRAKFKFMEAAERLKIRPQSNWKVVDMGAAPGGITQYLSEMLVKNQNFVVIVVDRRFGHRHRSRRAESKGKKYYPFGQKNRRFNGLFKRKPTL